MESKIGRNLLFAMGILASTLCYGHWHGGYGRNVIIINPASYGGYYNNYNYNPYANPYPPNY